MAEDAGGVPVIGRYTMIQAAKRRFLLAAGAAAVSPAAFAKDFPRVPTDWDGEGMFTQYAETGDGVSFAGPAGRPKAFIAFDPQCPWCVKLLAAALPLQQKIDFVWMPVAVLNIHSEPQGAAILSAKDRAAKLLEHEAHFKDKDFRGIRYAEKLLLKAREAVWVNSKIFRKNACRTVPFGVFKTASGEYRAIYSGMTTEALEKICDVK